MPDEGRMVTRRDSCGSGATSMQRIEQVIGQKGAFSRINNLDEYEWVATALKNDDINHLKQLWKKAFIDNAQEMFNNLGQTKMQQLFGVDNLTDFLDEIDDISSPIYNFIKVE